LVFRKFAFHLFISAIHPSISAFKRENSIIALSFCKMDDVETMEEGE
jgi:hypothetical protein